MVVRQRTVALPFLVFHLWDRCDPGILAVRDANLSPAAHEGTSSTRFTGYQEPAR